MNKTLKFIKKNSVILFLLFVIAVCLIVCLVFGFKIFWGDTNTSKYGHRTDDLVGNEFTEAMQEKVSTYLKENKNVSDVTFNVEGKIIYLKVELNSDLKLATAKKLASNSLKQFDENTLKHYEVQYILTTSVKNSKIYPTMGYKAISKTAISWINS